MFSEDLRYITGEFRKIKIQKQNQLIRKSTIVDNRHGLDMEIVTQQYDKHGRIKPLLLDDTQEN